jgi:hypothetical protein
MRTVSVLPMRPLTLGELLDAAVALLRCHPRALVGVALVLCALEQAALYPLRMAAGVTPPWYFPAHADRPVQFWLMLGVGFATEAAIIALLGVLAARAAGASVVGTNLPDNALLGARGGRFGAGLALAVVVGLSAGVAAMAGLLPWFFAYGLLGLGAPVLVIERRGPFGAIGRSMALSARMVGRVVGIRLIGYAGWLAIRVALGAGGVAALELVLPATRHWETIISFVTWVIVDALAYPTLACLDAALYLETRMRTEGLDISIALSQRRGVPTDLTVPR